MSTILKALQRLEGEKNANPDPTLDEQVIAPGSDPSVPGGSRSRLWIVAACLVAGIAVGSAAFVMWPEGDPNASTEAPGTEVAAAPAEAAAPSEVVTRTRSRQAPGSPAAKPRPKARPRPAKRVPRAAPVPASEPDVQILKRIESSPPSPVPTLESEDAAMVAEAKRNFELERLEGMHAGLKEAIAERGAAVNAPARPESRKRPTPQARPQPPVSQAPKPPAPEPAVVAAAEPAAPPTPVAKAAPRPNTRPGAKRRATPKPAPAVAPVPPEPVAKASPAPSPPAAKPASAVGTAQPPPARTQLRVGVPSVVVRRTLWHPDPERRVAIVEVDGSGEPLELREGDAVGPLVVESIEPTSVFFGHDGIAIRRRVGAP